MTLNLATIVLKGVPIELRKSLVERARMNGRSVSREVIACLESVVAPATAGPSIASDEIEAAKWEGRP
jgi:hypothetical protein